MPGPEGRWSFVRCVSRCMNKLAPPGWQVECRRGASAATPRFKADGMHCSPMKRKRAPADGWRRVWRTWTSLHADGNGTDDDPQDPPELCRQPSCFLPPVSSVDSTEHSVSQCRPPGLVSAQKAPGWSGGSRNHSALLPVMCKVCLPPAKPLRGKGQLTQLQLPQASQSPSPPSRESSNGPANWAQLGRM